MSKEGSGRDNTGFIKQTEDGIFSVIPSRIAPESLLATKRLVHEVLKFRHYASGRMLDIGCGTKPYKIVFENQVSLHIGIDVPYSAHSLAAIDVYSSATVLPFQNETFDFVLCTEVLEHVSDPEAAYLEIARVLKPGGMALVTTPFMYRIHEAPYDFYRYTPFAYSALAQRAGLTVKTLAQRGGYFTVLLDYQFKGTVMAISGIGRLLKKLTGHGAGLARTAVVRACLATAQNVVFLFLKNEKVKSDIYTLGYVVLLEKPPCVE